MRKHSPDEVERFFAPFVESSSTWARYRAEPNAEGALVHMAPGEGERFRYDTKSGRYRCVLPTCDGLFWVSAGEKNAHHWRHRSTPSVEHSPETLWHIAAKAVLVEFARTQRPDAVIQHDDKFTPSKNKPDVWVQWPARADGATVTAAGDVAFEAQHSAISTPGLKLRNARYEIDSIVPVWLFSHLTAPTIDIGLRDGAQIRLHEAHRVAAETAPLHWLNPDERTVATAYVRKAIRPDVHRGEVWHDDELEPITYTRPVERLDDVVSVGIDSLDDCTLESTGLHTPTDRWIESQAALAAAEEAEALAAYQRRFAHRFRPAPAEPDQSSGTTPQRPLPAAMSTAAATPHYFNPYAQPCRFCGGQPVGRNEWPSWYRSPRNVTEVAFCSSCGEILGSHYVPPAE